MIYNYILDSSALIEYLNGTSKGAKIQEIIENQMIGISIFGIAELADWF